MNELEHNKIAFLIAIDTEGDNVWAQPRQVTTRNAAYLPRFQTLCERFGLRPTYLVNWEMANDRAFQLFGNDILTRGTAEIGMHLHGWDTPPIAPLSNQDWSFQPYLFEYPGDVVRDKIRRMTGILQDTFQTPVRSHRAGRFGFDAHIARVLSDLGYTVDCSVTPHVDWSGHPGAPDRNGGPDFTLYPDRPYWLDLDDIAREGSSKLLELPMTIMKFRRSMPERVLRWSMSRQIDRIIWLRPNGTNLDAMLYILDQAITRGLSYVQFTLHSSEFMPDGSPTFRSYESIECLYDQIQVLFEAASGRFVGRTLTEFAATVSPP